MRYTKYLIILFIVLIPAKLFAQSASKTDTDITGLWKGTLYNDTTKKFYRYEIGISEEKGKLIGFSHTFFLVDNKEYYGVKKIRIRKIDGKIIIEDAGLIANNYPESPAKGVRQLNILTLEIKDSVMLLTGPFTTNRTKEYSSLTGNIHLQRKNDFWQSALVPHLQELGLSEKLSFVKKENDLAKAAADIVAQKEIAANKILKETTENKTITEATIKKEETKAISKNAEPSKEIASLPKKNEPVKEIRTTLPHSEKSAPKEIKLIEIKPVAPAAEVASRANVVMQTVYFASDSLQLTLYDNGEVDGDTVSVLMNGKIIMAKEGLSTNAVKKTIYAGKDTDSIQLVMYAENLGSIAPNTGLLVVHDGKNIYEIRFSGDLKKNASIVLLRRKN
jgi:hypothetical protein